MGAEQVSTGASVVVVVVLGTPAEVVSVGAVVVVVVASTDCAVWSAVAIASGASEMFAESSTSESSVSTTGSGASAPARGSFASVDPQAARITIPMTKKMLFRSFAIHPLSTRE